MGGKNKAPKAPNYSGLIKLATDQAEKYNAKADEQFQFFKDQYAKDSAINKQVVDAALKRQAEFDQYARDDRQRWQTQFQPLEDSLIKDAKDYASQERQDYESGKAQAAVAESYEANRQSAQRNLESYGIDPASTRYAALDAGSRIAQAAAAAAAGQQARDAAIQTGQALRDRAIQVGLTYPSIANAEANTGIQSGNAGINSQLATTTSGANTMGTAPQYAGIASGGINTAGNLMNNQYQNQLAGWQANQNSSSGIGSILGAGLGIASNMGWLADGGAIPDQVSPSGGQAVDDVPANLTAGEFVVPKDVLSWKGEEFFQGIIDKARKAKPQAPAQPTFGPPGGAPPQQAIPTGMPPPGAMPGRMPQQALAGV